MLFRSISSLTHRARGPEAVALGMHTLAALGHPMPDDFVKEMPARLAHMQARCQPEVVETLAERGATELVAEARVKGYEGEACGECGNFTLVRNGTCLKCDTCGATSGCS